MTKHIKVTVIIDSTSCDIKGNVRASRPSHDLRTFGLLFNTPNAQIRSSKGHGQSNYTVIPGVDSTASTDKTAEWIPGIKTRIEISALGNPSTRHSGRHVLAQPTYKPPKFATSFRIQTIPTLQLHLILDIYAFRPQTYVSRPIYWDIMVGTRRTNACDTCRKRRVKVCLPAKCHI